MYKVKTDKMDQNEFAEFEILASAVIYADRQRAKGTRALVIEWVGPSYYVCGDGLRATEVLPSWRSVESTLQRLGYQSY